MGEFAVKSNTSPAPWPGTLLAQYEVFSTIQVIFISSRALSVLSCIDHAFQDTEDGPPARGKTGRVRRKPPLKAKTVHIQEINWFSDKQNKFGIEQRRIGGRISFSMS